MGRTRIPKGTLIDRSGEHVLVHVPHYGWVYLRWWQGGRRLTHADLLPHEVIARRAYLYDARKRREKRRRRVDG